MDRRAVAALAVIVLGSAAHADSLNLNTNVFSNSPGGEFQITPLTGFAGLTGLPADLSAGTFATFCVEHNENFSPGGNYDFVINTGAVRGGLSGQTSPDFDPLSAESAYLYWNFRMGTLPGFDYSAAGRKSSSGALQDALWFLEGEGGVNNAFVALAIGEVAAGRWVGIGDVRVLNLSREGAPYAQDQLTIIPTPGAGLALGLVALVGRRRRA